MLWLIEAVIVISAAAVVIAVVGVVLNGPDSRDPWP